MTADLPPPLPDLRLGMYEHYKGGMYQVYGMARHSETFEALVVYRPMYGEGALWVRPFDMFTGQVMVNGVACQRFTWVGENPPSGHMDRV